MDDIRIRPPRGDDGPDLAAIWSEDARYYVALDPEVFQLPQAEGLAAWLEEQALHGYGEDGCVRVAAHGGRAVGMVMAKLLRPGPSARWQVMQGAGQVQLWVDALGVRESHRRRGIGTRLLQTVEAWARERGAVVAQLDTYLGSPLSVPFYEHGMGYRRQAVIFRKALAPHRRPDQGAGAGRWATPGAAGRRLRRPSAPPVDARLG